MTPTARDKRLLQALANGGTPRGSHNDVERLNSLLGEMCVNRAHPLHESPYLFLEKHVSATRNPEDVVEEWLSSAHDGQNND